VNKRAIPFVCTDEYWVLAKIRQQALHNVRKGDFVEIALKLYPGKILYGYVDSIAWAVGNTQLKASSILINDTEFIPAEHYFIKIKLSNISHNNLLRYGASGMVVVYTKKSPDVFKIIRRIEIRAKSYLYYLFNPF
jgi:multidrug resistance efflux pump